MAATSEQRRAAVVRRLKAEGPQPRPVFRSWVDIDAFHYRLGAVTGAANAGTASCRQMVAPESAPVGAAPHSVGQRTEGEAA